MSAELDGLLRPRSVAVIGASDGVTAGAAVKMGTAAIKYVIDHGFPGPIYPVNPRRDEVMGRPCYASVDDIPGEVDLAIIVLPAAACVTAMQQCADKGVRAAVVCSSGFSEAGATDLERELVSAARTGTVRFCGPNTAGLVSVNSALTASISMVADFNPFRSGEVAFVSQSGALGGSMLGRGMELGIGFSHWISTGNEADIDTAEYIEYLAAQDEVHAIALFLEGIRRPQEFARACRTAAQLNTPIVAYKTGSSAVAAEAAASHTGAIAGSDRVFDAVCRQNGVVRVDDVTDLFPIATALGRLRHALPRGNRVGIISASGGICGVGADECARQDLEVPQLSADAQATIRGFVPAFAATRNPIDVTGQIRASETGYQDTVRTVLAQDEIDLVMLLITMAGGSRASFYGREISALAQAASKPLLVAWTGPLSLAENGVALLQENGIPMFLTVRQTVRAARALVDYGRYQQRAHHLVAS